MSDLADGRADRGRGGGRRLVHLRDRPRVDRRRSLGAGSDRRVPQHLSAPWISRLRGRSRARQDLRLSVSPLGLRPPGEAAGRPGSGGFSAGAARGRADAERVGGYLGRVGIRQPRPGRRTALRLPGGSRGASRALSLRAQLCAHGGHRLRVAVQLEGRGRRVQRGLPRTGDPPRAARDQRRRLLSDRSLRETQPLPVQDRLPEPALDGSEGAVRGLPRPDRGHEGDGRDARGLRARPEGVRRAQ